MSDFTITSDRGQEMMTYLPAFYAISRIMKSNMNAQGVEMDKFWEALDQTLNQFFVASASWGLDLWEQELYIPTEPDKPIDQRRSVILSKMRGIGSVTISLIKSVAEAYDGGTVDVTVEPELYSFTVKFVDTLGIPPNLDDLKDAIEEIKPAHLSIEYEFTYYLYSDLAASGKVYSEITSLTYDDIFNKGLTM